MSNDLKYLMRSACEAYEAAGVQGENGAKAMREGLARIEELEAKLAECEARLGKAVDVDLIEQAISDVLSEGGTYRDAAEYVARATLAELKGDNADE